jgi:hypothetical protein
METTKPEETSQAERYAEESARLVAQREAYEQSRKDSPNDTRI